MLKRGASWHCPRSAGFQACCGAGFQTCQRFAWHAGEPWCPGSSLLRWASICLAVHRGGSHLKRPWEASVLQVWKPAIQQAWKPALRGQSRGLTSAIEDDEDEGEDDRSPAHGNTDAAANGNIRTDGSGVWVDRAGAFIGADGAHKRIEDDIEIAGENAIGRERDVDNVVRFQHDIGGLALSHGFVIDDCDLRLSERSAHDGHMGEVGIL